jgi:hypothetical protein
VVTDTRGELSLFMGWLDRHIALCMLEHYADQRSQTLDAERGDSSTHIDAHRHPDALAQVRCRA